MKNKWKVETIYIILRDYIFFKYGYGSPLMKQFLKTHKKSKALIDVSSVFDFGNFKTKRSADALACSLQAAHAFLCGKRREKTYSTDIFLNKN